MSRFSRYSIRDQLYASGRYAIYKAVLLETSDSFLIKTFIEKEGSGEEQAQLRHEYDLLERLSEIAPGHFPKLVEYIAEGGQSAIVFADEGYQPLPAAIPQSKMTLELFFAIAIQAAEILASIHYAAIIHKHLTPNNMLYNSETGKIQIHDFSIATELRHSSVPLCPPNLLQGSLEYMSPEQTGRSNRPLTQKADLYSLGIIFYEWLTGSLPFKSEDPTAIIFDHIATTPKTPHQINSDIPQTLSDIVMKLISKSAEERYKSALGLAYDLKRARDEFLESGCISHFFLAEKDTPTRLELPNKLYGRESELASLSNAFDELCSNRRNQLIAVSGYSGMGKTSLVRELIPKVVLSGGFYSSGKFSKFHQSDAYDGLRSALDNIVRYHLLLPESEHLPLKNRLLSEMGGILRSATDFIPSLAALVGPQEPLPEVSIEATQKRFELAIIRFIKIVSSNNPLVLFLDDLQYAKNSLFALLQKIILNDDIQNFMLIVGWRSNEVDESHPLTLFLNDLEKKRPVLKIKLEGIPEHALNRLLQDMLDLQEREVASLAHLIYKKTEGNCFFLMMLLETFYREGELQFDSEKGRWFWDEAKISSMEASDNVWDFAARRIEKFPPYIKDVLYLAACIGNSFTIEEIVFAKGGLASYIAECLQPALYDGFLIPGNLNAEWITGVPDQVLYLREYRFQHERIQLCCYETKEKEETKRAHLDLARRWYQSYENNLTPTRLLTLVDQFNRGMNYIGDNNEKLIVCRLNYEAGRIALESAAYEAAYQYTSIAKSFLTPNLWSDHYPLAYGLILSCIKCATMNQRFDELEDISSKALTHAADKFDKAKFLVTKGDLARIEGKTNLSYYEEGLRLLGYPGVAKLPNKLDFVLSCLIFRYYISKNTQKFEDLSTEIEKELLIGFILTERIAEESIYIGNEARSTYAMIKFLTTTFAKHDRALRAFSYGVFAALWPRNSASPALYNKADEILSSLNNKEVASTFYHSCSTIYLPWHLPFKELPPHFQKGIELNEQMGNLEASASNALCMIYSQIPLSLKDLSYKISQLENQIGSSSQRSSIRLNIQRAYIDYLCGDEQNRDVILSDAIIQQCQTSNYPLGEYNFYALKMSALTHAMKRDLLLKDRELMWSSYIKLNGFNIVFLVLPFTFYLFMLEIHAYPNLSFKEKFYSRAHLYSLYYQIKGWVKECPNNFLPYYLIAKAEYSLLKQNLTHTLALYDEAIEASTLYGVQECLALACQNALKVSLQNKDEAKAKLYADKAVQAYLNWGAHAIVEMLQEKYGDLLSQELKFKATAAEEPLVTEERYSPDADSIVLASEAIHKEIKLEGVLRNVMQLLAEKTEATRSAICLMQKGTLWVEGLYDRFDASIQTLNHVHWQEAALPQQILLNIWRRGKEIILSDAIKDTELGCGTYFAKAGTKCLIAVPIIRGDYVAGLIYCENNSTTHAFTLDNINLLRALALQLGSAVENARLCVTFEKFFPKLFLNQFEQEFIFDFEKGDSLEKEMNVLSMNIRNFTGFSEKRSASETYRFINEYIAQITPSIHSHRGFIHEFIGNRLIILFPSNSNDALSACLEIQKITYQLAKQLKSKISLKVDMALCYGSLIFGIFGEGEHRKGITIGNTIEAAAGLDAFNEFYCMECLITDKVKKELTNPDEFQLRHAGIVTLLDKKPPQSIWQVLAAVGDEIIRNKFIDTRQLFMDAYSNYKERRFDAAFEGFQQIYEINPDDSMAKFYSDCCKLYQKNPPSDDWRGEIKMTI